MPNAYDNYVTYERNLRRIQSLSPMTADVQENFYTYSQGRTLLHYHTMSTAGSFSPSSMDSQQMYTCDSNSMSPSQILNIIGNPNNNIIADTEPPMELKILVQPVDKFRFRYKSEMMGTHGSLLGEREESSHKKEVPTVQLVNCQCKNAVIRCTLVTADEERRFPHAHHLVRKDGNCDKDDPHDIEVSDENNYIAMFCNMGIIHTAKKNIKDEILRKQRIEVLERKRRDDINATITTREDLEMKTEAEKAQKWMNLNTVALCFQAFGYGNNNVLVPITDKIYSRPINNLKSALTGELRICRTNKHTISVEGNEEVWLLVEKVGKKNIKVKFYEVERDNVIWDADGKFSELDVHHQYAIVFKTPPYKDTNITETKEVYLKLERPSDGEVSNSIKFVYKPSDKVLNRKRPRLSSSSGSTEFNHNTTLVPQMQLENCVPMAETMIDISNLSEEIRKLLNEDTSVESEELKKYWDSSSTNSFTKLLSCYATQPTNNIVPDGASDFEKPQEEFAKNNLQKVMTILKETEMTVDSKQITINKVAELLQESSNYGDTPLHFSLRHEQYETAKCILMILSSDPLFKNISNLQNSSGKTPLHLAVLQNQPDIVRALLKVGADPNICDEEDATSLHNAVIVNAGACIDELLKSQIKLNLEAHTETGWSALHLAVKAGSLHAVKMLMAAGVDVNSTDMSYGRTALHIAVDSNHKHIVEYLLKETNIDVNMKNFGGNTALHSAVVKGGKCAEELIIILKKHGADPKIRNNYINREEEEEENGNPSTSHLTIDNTTIKSESSDSEEEEATTGESSFDLARNDPKLMQLLSDAKPLEPVQEELDLKEESEDEMTLQERTMMQNRPVAQENHQRRSNVQSRAVAPSPQSFGQEDEKLTDEHVKRLNPILNRTGGWERLAYHTNHGSLVRLYKKLSNPSAALFTKIRLQQPNITVKHVNILLRDIEASEAADTLEKS